MVRSLETKKKELEKRRLANGMLIDNLLKIVEAGNLVIPKEHKELVKEFRGLKGKTRDECIEYLDKCRFLRALCLALYPIEETPSPEYIV